MILKKLIKALKCWQDSVALAFRELARTIELGENMKVSKENIACQEWKLQEEPLWQPDCCDNPFIEEYYVHGHNDSFNTIKCNNCGHYADSDVSLEKARIVFNEKGGRNER